jgi:hypothetical protein
MNKSTTLNRILPWITAVVLVGLTAGCKGGGEGSRAPILGIDGQVGMAPVLPPVPPVLAPPQVTSTVPAATVPGPTLGIALNVAISAAFTDDMKVATMTGANFTVTGPNAAAVAGVVTYASRTALFTPSVALAPTTTYTAKLSQAMTNVAGTNLAGNLAPLAGPSDFVWTFTTGAIPDTTPPSVTLTTPATLVPGPVLGVATNTAIAAAFTKDMNPTTLTGASFTLTGPGATVVAGSVTYASRTALFTSTALLAVDTVYTATVTSAARDLAGNALAGNLGVFPAASNYVWTFKTGPAPDTTRPQVTLTVPATTIPGPTTGAAINMAIAAAFTEPMIPGTLTAASFTLTGPGAAVVLGSVGYASQTATFTPAAPLASATTYTATITAAATDLAGNGLAGNQAALPAGSSYVWTFTTGPAPDTTRPQVTLTVPATTIPGPTLGVPTNLAVAAAFTEPMAPASLTTASFTVAAPGGLLLGGNVTYASMTAVFTPSAALLPATTYTATITTAATDLAGNGLAGNQAAPPAGSSYVWTFTTGPAPDTTRPQVTLTVPATTIPGPTLGVPTNLAVAAAFTEPMAPASLTTASFTVAAPGGLLLGGNVAYASMTAVFTPSAALLPATTYTATVTTAATDLAGNALAGNQAALPAASNYVWTFTTAPAPDTTRPRVVLTVPATTIPGPTMNVPDNTAITALLTEDMDPLTITAASFTVTVPAPGVAPLGSVTYVNGTRTAVFTPASPLASGITYTATLTLAAKDLAGNALAGNQAALPAASDYVWTFSTTAPDVVPPTITLTTPADAVTNVAINTSVNATFSEGMDPLTLTTLTFTLQKAGVPLGPVIAGALIYDPVTNIVTLTPASPLAISTTYEAKVAAAKDLAGNLLIPGLVPNPWSFTTGNGLAPGAVPLGSASAFGIMATSAITSTGNSVINGDVSLDPGTSMTGFPPAVVNGSIHINDTVSAQARADLLVAYNFAKTLPPGVTISAGADLGALYPLGLAPGTYTSGSTMLVSTPLVLDGGGNGNAVWVFQIGSSLTTGASISLTNGAKAKNVFWVPTLDATVGVGTIFYGTIISGRDVTGVTGAVINGRILAGATLAGTIALDNNIVTVPAS